MTAALDVLPEGVVLDPLRPLAAPPPRPDWTTLSAGPDTPQDRTVDTGTPQGAAFFRSAPATLVERAVMSALYMAVSELGTTENPPNSNHVKYWGEVYPPANAPGMNWAWCAGFACAMYLRQGCDWRGLVAAPYYCPSIEAWARARGFWKTSAPLAGDLTLYGGSAEAVHIGIHERTTSAGYVAIEGNTSPGTYGSQDDGGGVYRRTRPRSWIRGWVDMRAAVAYYLAADVWDPVDGLARQQELLDWGVPVELDGYNGPETARKWDETMPKIDDVLDAIAELNRKIDDVRADTSAARRAVIADLTDEERVMIGTKAKSVSAGALLRTLARRVTATNSVTGKVNPEAMAEYEADLKDRVSKL